MDKTTTDELLVGLLSRVVLLEAVLRAFTFTWLRTAMPDADRATFRDHPIFKAFASLGSESINSAVASASDQFPDHAKVIHEHVELALRDLIESFGNSTWR